MATDVVDVWIAALEEAGALARGERLGELRGSRPPRFDKQGMHPYSRAWGVVAACERLDPVLSRVRAETGAEPGDPVMLRRLSAHDAEQAFAGEVIAQGGLGVFAR